MRSVHRGERSSGPFTDGRPRRARQVIARNRSDAFQPNQRGGAGLGMKVGPIGRHASSWNERKRCAADQPERWCRSWGEGWIHGAERLRSRGKGCGPSSDPARSFVPDRPEGASRVFNLRSVSWPWSRWLPSQRGRKDLDGSVALQINQSSRRRLGSPSDLRTIVGSRSTRDVVQVSVPVGFCSRSIRPDGCGSFFVCPNCANGRLILIGSGRLQNEGAFPRCERGSQTGPGSSLCCKHRRALEARLVLALREVLADQKLVLRSVGASCSRSPAEGCLLVGSLKKDRLHPQARPPLCADEEHGGTGAMSSTTH